MRSCVSPFKNRFEKCQLALMVRRLSKFHCMRLVIGTRFADRRSVASAGLKFDHRDAMKRNAPQ
jgi:hypothetical protein